MDELSTGVEKVGEGSEISSPESSSDSAPSEEMSSLDSAELDSPNEDAEPPSESPSASESDEGDGEGDGTNESEPVEGTADATDETTDNVDPTATGEIPSENTMPSSTGAPERTGAGDIEGEPNGDDQGTGNPDEMTEKTESEGDTEPNGVTEKPEPEAEAEPNGVTEEPEPEADAEPNGDKVSEEPLKQEQQDDVDAVDDTQDAKEVEKPEGLADQTEDAVDQQDLDEEELGSLDDTDSVDDKQDAVDDEKAKDDPGQDDVQNTQDALDGKELDDVEDQHPETTDTDEYKAPDEDAENEKTPEMMNEQELEDEKPDETVSKEGVEDQDETQTPETANVKESAETPEDDDEQYPEGADEPNAEDDGEPVEGGDQGPEGADEPNAEDDGEPVEGGDQEPKGEDEPGPDGNDGEPVEGGDQGPEGADESKPEGDDGEPDPVDSDDQYQDTVEGGEQEREGAEGKTVPEETMQPEEYPGYYDSMEPSAANEVPEPEPAATEVPDDMSGLEPLDSYQGDDDFKRDAPGAFDNGEYNTYRLKEPMTVYRNFGSTDTDKMSNIANHMPGDRGKNHDSKLEQELRGKPYGSKEYDDVLNKMDQNTRDDKGDQFRDVGWGSDAGGRWLTPDQYKTPEEAINNLALKDSWGNSADYNSAITLPEGTIVSIGKAAPQENVTGETLPGQGNQIYVHEIPRLDNDPRGPGMDKTRDEVGNNLMHRIDRAGPTEGFFEVDGENDASTPKNTASSNRPQTDGMQAENAGNAMPEGKSEAKPEQAEQKPESKPEAKPEQAEQKPESKPEAKPEQAEQKPESKPEAKPEQAEQKPESKPEAKPEQAEQKPESKPEAKPEQPEQKPEQPDKSSLNQKMDPEKEAELKNRLKDRQEHPEKYPDKQTNFLYDLNGEDTRHTPDEAKLTNKNVDKWASNRPKTVGEGDNERHPAHEIRERIESSGKYSPEYNALRHANAEGDKAYNDALAKGASPEDAGKMRDDAIKNTYIDHRGNHAYDNEMLKTGDVDKANAARDHERGVAGKYAQNVDDLKPGSEYYDNYANLANTDSKIQHAEMVDKPLNTLGTKDGTEPSAIFASGEAPKSPETNINERALPNSNKADQVYDVKYNAKNELGQEAYAMHNTVGAQNHTRLDDDSIFHNENQRLDGGAEQYVLSTGGHKDKSAELTKRPDAADGKVNTGKLEQAEQKPEAKPEQAEQKPESKPEAKPEQAEQKPESKPEAKPEQAEQKPEQAEQKPENKPESKSEKREAEPDQKSSLNERELPDGKDSKPESKNDVKEGTDNAKGHPEKDVSKESLDGAELDDAPLDNAKPERKLQKNGEDDAAKTKPEKSADLTEAPQKPSDAQGEAKRVSPIKAAGIAAYMGAAIKADEAGYKTVPGYLADVGGNLVVKAINKLAGGPPDMSSNTEGTIKATSHMFDELYAAKHPDAVLNFQPSPVPQEIIDKHTLVLDENPYAAPLDYSNFVIDNPQAENESGNQSGKNLDPDPTTPDEK